MKTPVRYHRLLTRGASVKKDWQHQMWARVLDNINIPIVLVKSIKSCNLFEMKVWQFCMKLIIPLSPSDFGFRYLPRRNESICPQKGQSENGHSIFLYKGPNCKHPRCQSTGGRINKGCSVYAMNRNTLLIHATSWMNFRNMTLSETSLTQKGTCPWIALCEVPKQATRYENTVVMWGITGEGREGTFWMIVM